MPLKEFYADPQRAGSEEVAFGSSWRSQGEGPWKVVWLAATGEVVAFSETAGWEPSGFGGDVGFVLEAAAEGVARLFRHGASQPHPERDEVVVIGVERDLLRLRGALLAWADHMPEENGLAWLAERVDDLSAGQTG